MLDTFKIKQIDMNTEESRLLERAAILFTNLGDDSTTEEKKEALRKEVEILEELHSINPSLAEQCGLRIERQMLQDSIDELSSET